MWPAYVLGVPSWALGEPHLATGIELTMGVQRHDMGAEGFYRAPRIDRFDDSSLLARTLAPVGASVIAGPAYLDRHGTPHHPLDLAGHRLVGYGHRERAMPLRFHRADEEATVVPSGPLFSNNGDEIGRASCRERVCQDV